MTKMTNTVTAYTASNGTEFKIETTINSGNETMYFASINGKRLTCWKNSIKKVVVEIERDLVKQPEKTPVHYTATGQAVELLNSQTPEQNEKWNAVEMEKIRRNDEANRRADNRRRGIANDEPTYENGIQEWDD